jgi:hypothetical protein
MAIGVGLIALYHTEAETYGLDLALGIVAAVLVVAALVLIIAAWLLGRSLSKEPSSELRDVTHELQNDATPPIVVPAAPPPRVPVPAASGSEPVDPTGDFMEPLAFLLAKYVKFPVLGHPVLDEVVGNLRVTSRETAEEAVERAADLERYGDRGQLFLMLRCSGRRMVACATEPRWAAADYLNHLVQSWIISCCRGPAAGRYHQMGGNGSHDPPGNPAPAQRSYAKSILIGAAGALAFLIGDPQKPDNLRRPVRWAQRTPAEQQNGP